MPVYTTYSQIKKYQEVLVCFDKVFLMVEELNEMGTIGSDHEKWSYFTATDKGHFTEVYF